MSLVERIDTICLTVKNVEEASIWYREVLGFKESYQGETYRILTNGSSKCDRQVIFYSFR